MAFVIVIILNTPRLGAMEKKGGVEMNKLQGKKTERFRDERCD